MKVLVVVGLVALFLWSASVVALHITYGVDE